MSFQNSRDRGFLQVDVRLLLILILLVLLLLLLRVALVGWRR